MILLEDFKPRVINMINIYIYICMYAQYAHHAHVVRVIALDVDVIPYFSRFRTKMLPRVWQVEISRATCVFFPPIFDVQICPKNPSFPEKGLSSSKAWW